MTTTGTFWYSRFRSAAYVGSIGSLVWTLVIVLPFRPFSYLPPIIVAGGPGTWFLLSYLLYLSITIGGFGALSFFLYVIEVQEKRTLNQTSIALGYALLNVGVTASCLLLAIAGADSGYGLTINKISETAAVDLLSSFVDPVTAAVLITVAGAALIVVTMARAKVRAG